MDRSFPFRSDGPLIRALRSDAAARDVSRHVQPAQLHEQLLRRERLHSSKSSGDRYGWTRPGMEIPRRSARATVRVIFRRSAVALSELVRHECVASAGRMRPLFSQPLTSTMASDSKLQEVSAMGAGAVASKSMTVSCPVSVQSVFERIRIPLLYGIEDQLYTSSWWFRTMPVDEQVAKWRGKMIKWKQEQE